MKLRNKILIGIIIAWASFLLIIYFGSYYFLSRNFLSTELLDYFLMIITVIAVLFALIVLWLLNTFIVKRLEILDDEVIEIRSHRNITKRVNITGNDEITSVAISINSMLNIIQASHDRLESNIEIRTQELQKTNKQLQLEIIERKTIEDQLTQHKEHLIRLAHYDSLTGLPNRVFFNEILNKAISHASRHKKLLAILFIDLDRFKAINDGMGHQIGDLVLKEIASRFSNNIRSEDMLARLGGDEFIILLNDIAHPKFASNVAEKLLQSCTQPIHIGDHEFYITASVGISIFPNDGVSLEELQRNADIAMYRTKKSDRGSYQYFTAEMTHIAHKHMKLETAMRKAIQKNEFVLYYQPKYDLKNGNIIGAEALIRWENPDVGLINPSEFIPLAEETGLIIQLGEWALRQACIANKKWQLDGYQPITIAVNLSPKQFRFQNISNSVSTILNETKLEPQYLELEITETTVMDNVDLAIIRLNEIRQMGIVISIDDFGTGYTSISNLKLYPVSVLKIDQNFIKGVPHNQDDTAIVSAVISLAHNLNIRVVAEGVETAEQLQYLADHECDIVQGYYLSRPLPEHKLIALLSLV